MNTAITILIILFALMLFLMFSILFYKEPETVPPALTQVRDEPETENNEIVFPDDPEELTEDVDMNLKDESDELLREADQLLKQEGILDEEFDLPEDLDDLAADLQIDDFLKQEPAQLIPDEPEADELDETVVFDQNRIDEMFSAEDPEFAQAETEPLYVEEEDEVPEFAPYEEESEPVTEPLEEPAEQQQEEEPEFLTPEISDELAEENVTMLRQGVRIAWPQSDVMMVSVAFGSSVLYVWEGLSYSNDLILFDVREKCLGYPLLETARKISDRNQKPACKFAVLIHTEKNPDPAYRQMANSFLRTNRRTPALVISDSAGEYATSKALENFEMITVGTRPGIILSSQAPVSAVRQIAEQTLKQVKTGDPNDTADEAFERIKGILPLGVRTGLKTGFGMGGALKKIEEMIPETGRWIRPSISCEANGSGSIIRIIAPDVLLLEDTVNEFRENMRLNEFTFRVLAQRKDSVPSSVHDEAFIQLEKAMAAAGIDRKAIPVLSDRDYYVRGIRTLSFAAERMDRKTIDRILMALIMQKQ